MRSNHFFFFISPGHSCSNRNAWIGNTFRYRCIISLFHSCSLFSHRGYFDLCHSTKTIDLNNNLWLAIVAKLRGCVDDERKIYFFFCFLIQYFFLWILCCYSSRLLVSGLRSANQFPFRCQWHKCYERVYDFGESIRFNWTKKKNMN